MERLRHRRSLSNLILIPSLYVVELKLKQRQDGPNVWALNSKAVGMVVVVVMVAEV